MLFNEAVRSNPLLLLILIPSLVISLTVHELCHGLMAYWLGDTTAKSMGRLSLNPLKHIDLAGFAFVLIAGFGWAKPVMVDPRNFKKPKIDLAFVSLAGPVSNLLMAFISTLAFVFLTLSEGSLPDWAVYAFQIFITMNVGLAVFNLLPIPPLDGSKIFGAMLPDNLYWRFMQLQRYGQFIIIGLILLSSRLNVIGTLVDSLYRGMIEVSIKIAVAFLGEG